MGGSLRLLVVNKRGRFLASLDWCLAASGWQSAIYGLLLVIIRGRIFGGGRGGAHRHSEVNKVHSVDYQTCIVYCYMMSDGNTRGPLH